MVRLKEARAVISDHITLFVLFKTCILTEHWVREGRPFRCYCSLTFLGVVDHYCGPLAVIQRKDSGQTQVGHSPQPRIRVYYINFKQRCERLIVIGLTPNHDHILNLSTIHSLKGSFGHTWPIQQGVMGPAHPWPPFHTGSSRVNKTPG
jgi:hypothetical protein